MIIPVDVVMLGKIALTRGENRQSFIVVDFMLDAQHVCRYLSGLAVFPDMNCRCGDLREDSLVGYTSSFWDCYEDGCIWITSRMYLRQ